MARDIVLAPPGPAAVPRFGHESGHCVIYVFNLLFVRPLLGKLTYHAGLIISPNHDSFSVHHFRHLTQN